MGSCVWVKRARLKRARLGSSVWVKQGEVKEGEVGQLRVKARVTWCTPVNSE